MNFDELKEGQVLFYQRHSANCMIFIINKAFENIVEITRIEITNDTSLEIENNTIYVNEFGNDRKIYKYFKEITEYNMKIVLSALFDRKY